MNRRAIMRDRMWTLADVAAFYGRGMTFAKRVVSQPGFPPPRLPGPFGHGEFAESMPD